MLADRTIYSNDEDTLVDRELVERLKIAMLATGLRITGAAMEILSNMSAGPLSVHEYPTTGGITLKLPHDVFVNAPFDEWYCDSARVELDSVRSASAAVLAGTEDGTGLVVRADEGELEVLQVLPLPGYIGVHDDAGRLITTVAMSHADRVRLSPLSGCAYDCSFCDIPNAPYELRPSAQLVTALQYAAIDKALPVRHAMISGGSPRRRDYDRFTEVCSAVIDAATPLGMPIDIMMSPTIDGPQILDRLVAAGAAGFAINLELYSRDAALAHTGRKYRVSRSFFADFVWRAIELVGRHEVRSLIIPGLESVADTLAGVEFLAGLGCSPVLSPFRPSNGIAASRLPPPSEADLTLILVESRAIVMHHEVLLGPACVPCQHNTLAFPWYAPQTDAVR